MWVYFLSVLSAGTHEIKSPPAPSRVQILQDARTSRFVQTKLYYSNNKSIFKLPVRIEIWEMGQFCIIIILDVHVWTLLTLTTLNPSKSIPLYWKILADSGYLHIEHVADFDEFRISIVLNCLVMLVDGL